MNRNQIVKTFISYLINKQLVSDQNEFGSIVGYPNKSVFSRKLSGKLDDDFMNKVQTSFPNFKKWKDCISTMEDHTNDQDENKSELSLLRIKDKKIDIEEKIDILIELNIKQNKKIDLLTNENNQLKDQIKDQNEDIKERIKDNLFVLQSEISAIMDEFNVQLDDDLQKDIDKIIQQN